MSGSFWFPEIMEYIHTHEMKTKPACVYFSLGDREDKARNPMLKPVRENTEALYQYYCAAGIKTIFRLQPGNHYYHAVERTAAGLDWLLRQ